MFPDSETHFFSEAIDVQLTFRSDCAGRFSQAVLRQYGDNTAAKRIK